MMKHDENAKQVRKLMLKNDGNFKNSEEDENMKHGLHLRKGGGEYPPPPFICKLIYKT